MELVRVYQYKFESKPGVFTLKSRRDPKPSFYIFRDFAVDFFETYALASLGDKIIELDATPSNISRFLSFAYQDVRKIRRFCEKITIADMYQIINIACELRLDGMPFFQYESYLYDFTEALSQINKDIDFKGIPEEKEDWYESLLELIKPFANDGLSKEKNLFYATPPKLVKLISRDGYYLWCPTETCAVLRKYREEYLALDFDADVINTFIYIAFPYHSSEKHPLKKGTTMETILQAIKLAELLKFDKETYNEDLNNDINVIHKISLLVDDLFNLKTNFAVLALEGKKKDSLTYKEYLQILKNNV